MTTEERILKAASEGVSVRAIAAEHGLSEDAQGRLWIFRIS